MSSHLRRDRWRLTAWCPILPAVLDEFAIGAALLWVATIHHISSPWGLGDQMSVGVADGQDNAHRLGALAGRGEGIPPAGLHDPAVLLASRPSSLTNQQTGKGLQTTYLRWGVGAVTRLGVFGGSHRFLNWGARTWQPWRSCC